MIVAMNPRQDTPSRRELIRSIVAGKNTGRCGLWLGSPIPDTWPIYLKHFGVSDPEEIRRRLGDDFRWLSPHWTCYKHPDGKPLWDWGHITPDLASPGRFADYESVEQIGAFDWPNPDYLDFSATIADLRDAGDVYRASGMWCCFFHDVARFFGMENFFVKMFTHPPVVEAAIRHVEEFYLEANRRFFAQAGGSIDALFMGNDLGTQRDLLVGPEQIDRFILPTIRKLAAQAHEHGYQVIQHSCGCVHRLIGRFIDAGIDALHPLQARATNMDAATLARDFKGRIAFVGGIDTQDLLVHGTPQQVRDDVQRVKHLLGPNLIVSPSHEGVLPNVPPQNIEAMAQAVYEAHEN